MNLQKGSVLKLQLHDGRIIRAIVLYRNGSTYTVKAADGFVYDTPWDSQDSEGIYYAS